MFKIKVSNKNLKIKKKTWRISQIWKDNILIITREFRITRDKIRSLRFEMNDEMIISKILLPKNMKHFTTSWEFV